MVGFKTAKKIASAPARRAASLPILGYKPLVATRLNNSVRQAASRIFATTRGLLAAARSRVKTRANTGTRRLQVPR
jgi:hypothetical protein